MSEQIISPLSEQLLSNLFMVANSHCQPQLINSNYRIDLLDQIKLTSFFHLCACLLVGQSVS